MTFWTNDQEKIQYVQYYFSSLNSMAARIIEKQQSVRNTYSTEKWNQFSVDDKEKIMDQCIVLPKDVSKYNSTENGKLPEHYHSVFPRLVVDTGQSLAYHLEDDANQAVYKDEHSNPFSWETRSQMKIALPSRSEKSKRKKKKNGSFASKVAGGGESLQNGFRAVENVSKSKPQNSDTLPFNEKVSAAFQSNASRETVKKTCHTPVINQQSSFSTDNGKFDFGLTKATVHSNSSAVKETKPVHSLPEKEVKKKSAPKKQKSSSRINPRSSVTLDDHVDISINQKQGAIRNLEIAMQEEEKAQGNIQSTKPPAAVKKPSFQLNLDENFKTSTEKEETRKEDSPLLGSSSPTLSLNFDDFSLDVDTSAQKSGFDFLDNW